MKSKTPAAIPSGYQKPPVIGSSVTFSGANTTTVTKPAQLQQLQAALACALGTPLENIQITNITYVDSSGKPHTLAFDASVAQLNSNGTVACYTSSGAAATPAPTLRGRRLQAVTANDAVVIEYAILDPPAELVLSDPATFIDTVTTASVIQDYAATVDSTAIVAEVPVEVLSYAAAGAPPPDAPTTSSALNSSTIAGISLCVVGVLGIAGAIMMVRKRKADQQKIITRTVHVVEMNPVARNLTFSDSARAIYVPNQVR